MTKLRNTCDVHTHTLFSRHAYSTVEENMRAASERGLELVGITDHFSAMVATSHNIQEYQHFCNMKIWPREWYGVRLMRGAEADIVDDEGNLFGHDLWTELSLVDDHMRCMNLRDLCLKDADYVICSIHGKEFCHNLTPSEATRMYVKALEHPKALIVGHVVRAGVPVDVDALVAACAEMGKLIEINEHSFEMRAGIMDGCREVAKKCMEKGVSVVVNTDAHISCDIGRTGHALAMLEGIGFPQELVATRSAEAFLAAMDRAGLTY